MADRLNQLGYVDYRRSDAAALRLIRLGPVPIGRLGSALGTTRQAARKVVDGLGQRNYVRTERDVHDSRQLNVVLTPGGEAYARAVVEVIDALNRELCARVDLVQLAAADAVLRAAISGDNALEHVAGSVRPPS
jgi:DNA-binding MarR family transcriptional regulator